MKLIKTEELINQINPNKIKCTKCGNWRDKLNSNNIPSICRNCFKIKTNFSFSNESLSVQLYNLNQY
jgi:NMD protein affecting ribosome stability and mRNA decay